MAKRPIIVVVARNEADFGSIHKSLLRADSSWRDADIRWHSSLDEPELPSNITLLIRVEKEATSLIVSEIEEVLAQKKMLVITGLKPDEKIVASNLKIVHHRQNLSILDLPFRSVK